MTLNTSSNHDNDLIIRQALDLFENDKTLEAFRLLRNQGIKLDRYINDEDNSSSNEELSNGNGDDISQQIKQIVHDGTLAESLIKEFESDDGWKLCVEKDSMQSFYKAKGSGMHSVKVQGTIQASMFQVLSIFYEGKQIVINLVRVLNN